VRGAAGGLRADCCTGWGASAGAALRLTWPRLPPPAGDSTLCRTSAVVSRVALAREVPADGSTGLAGQIQCYVPDYSTATCLPKLSLTSCLRFRALGNVYQRWAGRGDRWRPGRVRRAC
jgi:hypothetical protein